MAKGKVIDVSSWQHPNGQGIDWHAVAGGGVVGVVVKSTQGTNYVNPFFKGDIEGAENAGLLVGAYHFAQPARNDAESEAAFALNEIKGLNLPLGFYLDLEDLGGFAPHECSGWAETWLAAVDHPSWPAGLYTDDSIFGALVGAPWGKRLWIADPSGKFGGPRYMTQTGQGEVVGVPGGSTDLDVLENTRGTDPGPSGVATATPAPAEPAPGQDVGTPTEYEMDGEIVKRHQTSVTTSGGHGWVDLSGIAPNGVGSVVSVEVVDLDPAQVNAYPPVPAFKGITGDNKAVFGPGGDGAPPDGSWGVVVFVLDTVPAAA